MTKLHVTLISLVAAVPGALLAYLMVMAFLNYGGGSSGFFKGLAGVSLLLGAMLALMPVGIFVFSGPKADKKKKADEEGGSEGEGEKDDAVEAEGQEDSYGETLIADSAEELEAEDGGLESSDDLQMASDDDLDMESSEELEATGEAADDADFEIADDEVAAEGEEDLMGAGSFDETIDELEVTSSGDQEFDFDEEEDEDPPAKGKRK